MKDKGGHFILLVIHEHMQSFKIVALHLLAYFWLVEDEKKKKNVLIIIATLATAVCLFGSRTSIRSLTFTGFTFTLACPGQEAYLLV